MMRTKIEVCCGRIEDCIVALTQDIDRIELNSALELGGLTPSLGTFIQARSFPISLCPMVRPRTGGFLYTPAEYASMLVDARHFLELGADGIVFGFLTHQGTIDAERTGQLAGLCAEYQAEAVFHKAFDSAVDLDAAMKTLIRLGITRVLTGAGLGSVETNLPELARLQRTYGEQIEILPGGGVRLENIGSILATGVSQIHMTAKGSYDDGSMRVKDPSGRGNPFLGTDGLYLEKAVGIVRNYGGR